MRIACLALLLCAATPAIAQNGLGNSGSNFGDPALTQTPITTNEIGCSYADTADTWRQDYMRRLNSLCRSKAPRDQSLCSEAWRVINAAYAELEAKKTNNN